MDRSAIAHWDRRSLDWSIRPPLAPSPEDVAWFEAMVRENIGADASRPVRGLLLGVTPALATMRLPSNVILLAVDFSAGMIRRVWPGPGTSARSTAIRADWRQLPFPSASLDFVLADGASGVLADAVDTALLRCELYRVLRTGGMFCERYFSRPPHPLSVDRLFEQLLGGQLDDLDLFRILLAMAAQSDTRDGVILGDVWKLWRERVPNPEALKNSYAWTDGALSTFESWRGVERRQNYPDQGELEGALAPWFDLIAVEHGGYPMADYFPRLLLRRRP